MNAKRIIGRDGLPLFLFLIMAILGCSREALKGGVIDRQHYLISTVQSEATLKRGELNNPIKSYSPGSNGLTEKTQKNEKLNGLVKVYFSNGKVMNETHYKDGIPDGLAKDYYKSGGVRAEAFLKNGLGEGVVKRFYENGRLQSETIVVGGKCKGVYKEYYANGKTRLEVMCRDNVWNGPGKFYYNDGSLKWEFNYVGDEREGLGKKYYRSGHKKAEINYLHDLCCGPFKEFYENGAKLSETNYKQGLGLKRIYYDSGELKEERPYRRINIEDGDARGYYKNGSIEYIDTYENGVKVKRKRYFKDGKLEFVQDYGVGFFENTLIAIKANVKGKPRTKKTFGPSDQLKTEETYVGNVRNGISKTYYEGNAVENENKVLEYEDIYNNGKLIKRRKYDLEGRLEFTQGSALAFLEK